MKVTNEQFVMALDRMGGVVTSRAIDPGVSEHDLHRAKSLASAIESIRGDKELVAAAVEVLVNIHDQG